MGFAGDIYNSFKTNAGGLSARKISAFTIMVCVVMAHIAWLKYAFIHENFSLLPEILTIDFGFISVCLGLTTIENLKKKPDQPTDEQAKVV